MSGQQQVDLSQIRGDWYFHMKYLMNAIERTLERQKKLWEELGEDDADIASVIGEQARIWQELTAKKNDKGVIPVGDALIDEFIDKSKETKPLCDAYEEANDLAASYYHTDTTAERFTEACRQVRSLCEDLVMMREQAPS